MAWYKDLKYLSEWDSEQFDKLHEPGSRGSYSGIYRCEACGKEIVHTKANPLPPQNHHEHDQGEGRILWRLIVTDEA
jgi:hypothetical protein